MEGEAAPPGHEHLHLLQQAAQSIGEPSATPQVGMPVKAKRKASKDKPSKSRIMNCNNCRIKKMRCDRKDPCSNCEQRSISCEWEVGPPPPHTPPEVLRQNTFTILSLRREVATLSSQLALTPEQLDALTAEADSLVLASRAAAAAAAHTPLPKKAKQPKLQLPTPVHGQAQHQHQHQHLEEGGGGGEDLEGEDLLVEEEVDEVELVPREERGDARGEEDPFAIPASTLRGETNLASDMKEWLNTS